MSRTFVVKSSNQKKIAEMKFAQLPESTKIEFQPGEDLPEIQTDDFILVAAYKSQTAGENVIIEDSFIAIEDEHGVIQPIIDIKFRLDEIRQNVQSYMGRKAVFVSTVAVNVDDEILIQTCSIKGVVGTPYREHGPVFGFDDFFYLEHDGEFKALHYVKKVLNLQLSPRINSLCMLFKNMNDRTLKTEGFYAFDKPLPEWKGEYQS